MEKIKKDLQNVRVAVVKNRAQTIWVDINIVMPNPLNPRKNDAVNTEVLQSIIRSKGWEMPLTAYKKGTNYILLSGHRRRHAAILAGVKEVPVFVVAAPQTHKEEVERIASVQHQEDWTVLEWATHIYQRWLAWGRPGMKSFSEEIGKSQRTVESYVKVLDYFPLHDIEPGLNQKLFSMSYLLDLMFWIKKVKELKPALVESLTEEMFRRVMVDKVEKRKTSKESLRKKEFLEKVSDKDLREFLFDKEMHLEELMTKYEFNIKEKTFHAQLVSMGFARKSVKNINPKNAEEAKKAAETLLDLKNSLEIQIQQIDRKFPRAFPKEDLFEWGKK